MKILWVTSFAKDMMEASGKGLIDSFQKTKSEGQMFVGLEDMSNDEFFRHVLKTKMLPGQLHADSYLADFLKRHEDIIPEHLGGKYPAPECRCPDGPHDVRSKKHKEPCIGSWFNKNFSRWFRKLATLRLAMKLQPKAEVIIWVDSDCRFLRRVSDSVVHRWFGTKGAGIFYFKSTRPVMEAGIVGYRVSSPAGRNGLHMFMDRYDSGAFRADPRWDDSFQLQQVIKSGKIPAIDLARRVGDHAAVIPHSSVGVYIDHMKGLHGRKLGIMT